GVGNAVARLHGCHGRSPPRLEMRAVGRSDHHVPGARVAVQSRPDIRPRRLAERLQPDEPIGKRDGLEVHPHHAAPSPFRKARTAAGSTALSTKASPMARTRIRVSPPPSAFLSPAIRASRADASNVPA